MLFNITDFYSLNNNEDVFSKKNNEKYVGNLFLETDETGKGSLVDKVNGIVTPFEYGGLRSDIVYKSNMIYPVKITGFESTSEEKPLLTATGIVYDTDQDRSIFWVNIAFEYNENTFTFEPSRIYANDFVITDISGKGDEKPVETILFEYDVKK